jgi:hypothetical protein
VLRSGESDGLTNRVRGRESVVGKAGLYNAGRWRREDHIGRRRGSGIEALAAKAKDTWTDCGALSILKA